MGSSLFPPFVFTLEWGRGAESPWQPRGFSPISSGLEGAPDQTPDWNMQNKRTNILKKSEGDNGATRKRVF